MPGRKFIIFCSHASHFIKCAFDKCCIAHGNSQRFSRHYHFRRSLCSSSKKMRHKNWIFQLSAEIIALEKVDHFVGKNQCNQACEMTSASLKMRVSSLSYSSWEWERKTEKWKFQRHLERMSLITNLHYIIKVCSIGQNVSYVRNSLTRIFQLVFPARATVEITFVMHCT